MRPLVLGFFWLAAAVGVLWAFGALWHDFPVGGLRRPAAVVFLVTAAASWFLLRPGWRALVGTLVAVALVLGWWLTLEPRQDRDWKPEVARTAHAEIDGDIVTVHNVRNFDHRTAGDFTVRHETRRFDLRRLRGADLFVNYWGSPFMAHPIVSFDFGSDGRICFSIETRQERGEGYSAIGGLYRQYELIYVVADERDVVRLRTNFRMGEDVFLYRLKAPRARESFLSYIETVNDLHAQPRWYHAVTNNCTTAIRHQRTASERAPWDWRMLVNGFGDELLYERGVLDTSLPFDELKKASWINEKAQAADTDPAFSERLREGLPGFAPASAADTARMPEG